MATSDNTDRYPVEFDSETDLEYLGVGVQDIRRNQWVLEQDGLLEQSKIPGKLSLLNKVEDPSNIARLRSEIQAIWASGPPL